MIHFFRIRFRALLYRLRMQQGFTQAQIRGTLILCCFIIAVFFLRYTLRAYHEKKETLTQEERRQMDSLLRAVPTSTRKHRTFQYSTRKTYRPASHRSAPKTVSAFQKYDLNLADSLQLISLSGVGPVLAARILKFRKALGGFYRKEQLYEIWGIDSLNVNRILPQVYITEGYEPERIHLNTADYITLKDHPYISPLEASAIMKYKKKKGKFLSLSELESIIAQYDQLKHYLILD